MNPVLNIATSSKYFMTRMLEDFTFKVIASVGLSVFAFLFDSVLKEAMAAILILIIFDFITGVAAAKKSGDEIKSATALRTAIKVVVYFMLISAGRMTEIGTSGIMPLIDETIIAFLAVTELISIMENSGTLGFYVPQKMLNKLKEYKENK